MKGRYPLRLAAILAAVALEFFSAAAGAAPARLPRIAIETAEGRIVVEVDVVRAPITAANFLRQVDEGRYRAASFYRTVRRENNPKPEYPMTLIQGGIAPVRSPLPPIPLETTAKTGLKHVDGAISMGRVQPNSAQSEFFIVIGATPALSCKSRTDVRAVHVLTSRSDVVIRLVLMSIRFPLLGTSRTCSLGVIPHFF